MKYLRIKQTEMITAHIVTIIGLYNSGTKKNAVTIGNRYNPMEILANQISDMIWLAAFLFLKVHPMSFTIVIVRKCRQVIIPKMLNVCIGWNIFPLMKDRPMERVQKDMKDTTVYIPMELLILPARDIAFLKEKIAVSRWVNSFSLLFLIMMVSISQAIM